MGIFSQIPLWIIITLIMLIVLVVLFRMLNQIYILNVIKKNFFYFFIICIFVFLSISLVHIHSTYHIDFTSMKGIIAAAKIYWSWLVNVFRNIGHVTGYATKQNWFNVTNYSG